MIRYEKRRWSSHLYDIRGSMLLHLRRALILYCFSMPFAIVSLYGWWTVLVTLLIAYTLWHRGNRRRGREPIRV